MRVTESHLRAWRVAVIATACALAPSLAASQSALANTSFEDDVVAPAGAPDAWTLSAWIPSQVSTTLDPGVTHEGNRSLRVGVAGFSQNAARWHQTVSLEPNRNYLLSGWIRTENIEATLDPLGEFGAHLAVGDVTPRTQALVGTRDWTYVRLAFNSGTSGSVVVSVGVGNVYGRTRGTAWFDDLRVTPIQATDPHPSWKILVLIYQRTDFTYADTGGAHHLVGQMTDGQVAAAASAATRFFYNDVPPLTSGHMTPRLTIRYPGTLTSLSAIGNAWWPAPSDTAAHRDPDFDSVIVIWQPTVRDQATGQSRWIGNAAGLAQPSDVDQTYCTIIIEAAITYGHLNVFKHEWGHSILFYFDAAGTAPKPAINNHSDGLNYVNCLTGQRYVWRDETDAAPIPNSIYNNYSGFTHDYYSGTTALVSDPTRCLGVTPDAWAAGGPVSPPGALPGAMSIDKDLLRFAAVKTATALASSTAPQVVRLTQTRPGTVTWTATPNVPWVIVTPSSGSGSATLTVAVEFAAGLPTSGLVSGAITLSLSGAGLSAEESQDEIAVAFSLKPSGASLRPFGAVDTPLDNQTGVAGAVPFTGWALDDLDVVRVAVCRAPAGPEAAPLDPNCGGAAQVFVGFATFIDGARPDVERVYSTHPRNSIGGWGFMVLTNMLPSQGNGTYQFHVWAHDREGHAVLLGSRTMTCANASATLPFGAIDTPEQGGVASGGAYVNFGWALTPLPKTIPIDGSTITVLVDGVAVGTADYNHFRSDITTLFPGLNNTTGAIGFRVLDTTTQSNGLHTIVWVVSDNQGAREGIGSRFFTVSNAAGTLTLARGLTTTAGRAASVGRAAPDRAAPPLDRAPLLGRRGWDLEAPLHAFHPDATGRVVVRSEEVNRVELHLGSGYDAGYLRTHERLQLLPIGSHFDATTGVFTWAPGVGFVGAYDLVFVRADGTDTASRRDVRIMLTPKGSGLVGPQVVIDTPRSQQDVAQPFVLAGWAADLSAAQGTGIATLHAWAYPLAGGPPLFLGATAYGGARPDVAAVHGEEFEASGFGLHVQALVPGHYDLAVFAWSTERSDFVPAKVVRITAR